MCGITGKISFGYKDIGQAEIMAMNKAIAHRGPDDTGVYISPNRKVGLGHQRLSIIDLSSNGHQPMHYLDRYTIVFNGEIYNFQEERRQLEKLGYTFISHSDTEVILALYDRYQEKCLEHLRGMFAFAIYDAQTQTLFCARDRVGKKPFKYYLDNQTFIFASELKAILTQEEYKKEVDYAAIHHYLTLQYVPAPLTGFLHIKKLPPAHYLKINVQTQQTQLRQYWHLDYSQPLDLSEKQWSQAIMSELAEATKLRMVADVPIGAFLSGGIDSSTVVALMAQQSPKAIKTFSIGFTESEHNELPFAREIAALYKTDHAEFIVKPDAIDVLPHIVKQYEEPYADSSALPTYYVSQLSRQHVKVVLNGDGGDENFAGYGRYSVQKFALRYSHWQNTHKHIAQPVVHFLAKHLPNTFSERSQRFASTLHLPIPERYLHYICYFTNAAKQELYTDSFRKQMANNNTAAFITQAFAAAHTPNVLDQTLYCDFTTYLPDDLLVKVDMATMLVGLEARSPFLDQKVLELTAKIPFQLKLKGLNNKKYILKKALQGTVSDSILNRPKMGFGVPIAKWFRGDLHQYAKGILLSPQALNRNLFKPEAVRQLLDTHRTSHINFANHIWALLTLELWFREYFG